jgi:hypothetical protein
MFSALPREIVHRILDLYADTIGVVYLSLRPVNKQICAYIDGTARNYIRGHCYAKNHHCAGEARHITDYCMFMSALHTRMHKISPSPTEHIHILIRTEHKYLPIIMNVISIGRRSYPHGRVRVGGFYIYIGDYDAAFDVYHDGDPPRVTIAVVASYPEQDQYILGFIRKYFAELYDYLMASHRA